MFKSKVFLSLLLSTSATVVLANSGNLIHQPDSSWQMPSPIVPNTTETVTLQTLPNDGVNGFFKYKIEDDPNLEYYFQIQLTDGICAVDEDNSDYKGTRGEWLYSVKVTKAETNPGTTTAVCELEVSRELNPNPSIPVLEVKHYQYLNVGAGTVGNLCNNSSQTVGVRIGDVEAFTYEKNGVKEHYIAVTVSEHQPCSDGGATSGSLHIYKWNGSQFEHVQKLENFVYPTAIESYYENIDKDFYLVVADNREVKNSLQTGLVKIFLKSNENDSFILQDFKTIGEGSNYPGKVNGVTDINYFEIYDEEENEYKSYLLFVQGGNAVTGYGNGSTLVSWDKSDAVIEKIEDTEIAPYAKKVLPFRIEISSEQPLAPGEPQIFNQNTFLDYFAFAYPHNNHSYILESSVWKFGLIEDKYLNEVTPAAKTYGGSNWEHIFINNKNYLVIANERTDDQVATPANSYSYIWDPNKIPFQNNNEILATNVAGWEHVKIGSANYFFAAQPNENLYSNFNEYSDINTLGSIYIWCEQNTEVKQCTNLPGWNNVSNLYKYAEVTDAGGVHQAYWNTTAWDSIVIDGTTYMIRTNSLITAQEGVQILKVEEK